MVPLLFLCKNRNRFCRNPISSHDFKEFVKKGIPGIVGQCRIFFEISGPLAINTMAFDGITQNMTLYLNGYTCASGSFSSRTVRKCARNYSCPYWAIECFYCDLPIEITVTCKKKALIRLSGLYLTMKHDPLYFNRLVFFQPGAIFFAL